MKVIDANKMLLYIGTYTKESSEGIYIYEFDSHTQTALPKQIIPTENPSYFTFSANKQLLYTVNESGKPMKDTLSAFVWNEDKQEWLPHGKISIEGTDPCYVSVAPSHKHLIVANYSSGSLTVVTLDENGKPTDVAQLISFTGNGPDKARQEAAHIHCVKFSTDGQYLFANDLGSDEVNVFEYKEDEAKPLALINTIKTTAGGGPRHLLFNKAGTFAYLILELNASIEVYTHHSGNLTLIQTIKMEDASFKGEHCAAELQWSNDERFLYASNRGDSNSMTVFQVDAENSLLTLTERISTKGKDPRNFMISPCDGFIMIAHQYSNDIQLFGRDGDTGRMNHIKELCSIDSPVFIKPA